MDRSFYMRGMSGKSLVKNWSLAPLFGFLALGAVAGGGYLLRLALKSPDVSWAHGSNPEFWRKFPASYQHKFYAANIDYKSLKHSPERPEI